MVVVAIIEPLLVKGPDHWLLIFFPLPSGRFLDEIVTGRDDEALFDRVCNPTHLLLSLHLFLEEPMSFVDVVAGTFEQQGYYVSYPGKHE